MKYRYAILGGSGHIGTALTAALLKKQQSVLIIGHDEEKAAMWETKGVAYEVVDVNDSERLEELFGQAERIFILNPPAPPDSDAEAVELKQIHAILEALKGLAPKKIVAASAYGARKGDYIFDLGTLYHLEQGLAKLNVPLAIIRSAYYMSNFEQAIPAIGKKGGLATLFPVDFKLRWWRLKISAASPQRC